jgi:hypothetical protein
MMHSTYLNNAETQNWSSHVADPHTCEHSHTHAGQEHVSRFGSGFAQGESRHHLCDVVLAKCGSNREAAK